MKWDVQVQNKSLIHRLSKHKIRQRKNRLSTVGSAALLLLLIVILTGCNNNPFASENAAADQGAGKFRITATTGMIADAARQVGGEHVYVTGLMGPGVDPHMYKASQGDIRKLDEADLVLYNGLHLEGSMTNIMEKMSRTRNVAAVTASIPASELRQSEENASEHDPHIWFDVRLWMQCVEQIRDSLIAADPDHAQDYQANAAAYLAELKQLDEDVREQIASIPQQSRVLVTAHDAFGYYGDAYNIEVRGLQGISTASEYGSRDVSELRDMLVERSIKAVFVESSVPARSMEAIIAGAAQQGHMVNIGGELYSDALGEQGSDAGDYIGMVRHNTDTIVKALR
ncbi:metal ABC transporter solute-binding protein, Zn/Mn family [Paenibacillus wulumuqiensis]|uniref:metal ABC transporter solute-binding protein, Zn/Mn family n=1 Tax=Paenibacillus wulumuqiensis TaxID=1567107 RepID=UPI0009E33848|nr:zinc ABC transporter substrate-binding protein [Paenibacillus wulumuqiensis]